MRILPLLCLAAALLPACARPDAATANHAGEKNARGIYHLGFAFTTTDSAAKSTVQSFEQIVDEEDISYLHAGKNVPLVVPSLTGASIGPAPRQDVGLKVTTRLQQQDGRLVARVDFEQSAADPDTNPVSIRKLSANGKAVVTPGQPSEIFRIDEGGKRYALTVVVHRL